MPFPITTAPGSSGGGTITGANNGVSVTGANIRLGHLANGGVTGDSDFTTNRDLFLSTFKLTIAGSAGYELLSINGNTGVVTFVTPGLDYVYVGYSVQAILALNTSALGVTATNYKGFSLINTSNANAGAQQISPNLLFEGSGWKTNATAGAQKVRFRLDLLPVEGTVSPSGILRFSASINGATYTDPFTIDTNGNIISLGSYTIGTDTLITTQTAASITVSGTATNIGLVLNPKGTGFISAHKPNGAASGGNARGDYAIDFQLSRSAANQVASGNYSIIVGGQDNRVVGTWSFIGGGTANYISGGSFSVIVGGYGNTVNNSYAICIGGLSNSVTANYGIAGGNSASAYLLGQRSYGSSKFANAGDNQNSNLMASKSDATLTTGKTTVLYLDGSGAAIIPTGTNRGWNVIVQWIGIVTAISGTATGIAVGDVIAQTDYLLLKKVGGTSTLVDTPTSIVKGIPIMKTALMTYTIGGSNDLLTTFSAPVFAGGGTLTMRITASITLTEVAY